MLVTPDNVWTAILAELVDVGNLWAGAKVGLYQNPIVLARTTRLADLTPAAFTGYALSAAVVWGVPFVNVNGEGELLGDMKSFVQTGTVATNTVQGYYVINAAADTLLWAEAFSAPVSFTVTGKTLPVIPRYLLGQRVA